jgi:hypothetical protein
MRLLVISMGIALVPSVAFSQTQIPGTPYTRLQQAITYTELTQPTVVINSGSSQDVDLVLPFQFRFYDQLFDMLVAGNAGCISFQPGAAISTSNQSPGDSSSFSNIDGWIAPFWESFTMQSAQDAHLAYQVFGTTPNRWITFEWKNANRSFSTSGMQWFNFQLRLFEGLSGRIEIDYGPQGPEMPTSVSASMGMENLMSGQAINFAASACVPPPPGSGNASCTLADYNQLIGQRIILVQDPGVELVGLGIQTPEFATLGVDVPVRVLVANLHGTALGPFNLRLSASANEDGSNATEVGSLTVSLSPYQSNEITLTMNGPLNLGESSFHLVLDVDSGGAVAEVDENNNRFVSPDRVRFLPSRADLVIERVTVNRTSIAAGGSAVVTSRITNAGSQPVTGGEVAVMMSTNMAISPQDVELARFDVSLQPQESIEIGTPVTIPAGTNTGTYWLGTLADPSALIEEVSEANNGRAALSSISVSGGNLAILTSALPSALIGQTYVAILTAAGGSSAVTWSVTQGDLPPGIGLVGQTGEFFGRAQTEGSYTFTVQATSGGQTDTQQLTLDVTEPEEPLTIVTRALPSAVVGQEYEFELRVVGGAMTSSLAWTATGLPTGIELIGGVLSGSAIEVGTHTLGVTVTSGGETATRDLTLDVIENANLQIVPTQLPAGRYGEPYSAMIAATGGVPPITFTRVFGDIPDGLEFGPDGTLSGTPLEVGKFRLVFQAIDSGVGGTAAVDVNSFELVIEDAPGFIIETTELPEAVVDTGYNAVIHATGGVAPYDWQISGLPKGMVPGADDAAGGLKIDGSTSEPGVRNLLVTVVDQQGRKAERAIALVVREAAAESETPDSDGGCGCATTRGSHSTLGLLMIGAVLAWRAVRHRRSRRD